MNIKTLVPVLVVLASALLGAQLVSDCADADETISVTAHPDGRTFTFSAGSSGTWDFGDDTAITGKSEVTHLFKTSGLHIVSFRSVSGSGSAAALVTDPSPVTSASVGVTYNYCPGLSVTLIKTNCPGLSWDAGTYSLTGKPTSAGDYTVSVYSVDGSVSVFTLSVTSGNRPLDRSFDVETDGLSVHVTARSAGTPGIQYKWTVADVDGKTVALGIGAECTFDLPSAGTYVVRCLVTDSSMVSDSTSQMVTVTAPDDKDDRNDDDEKNEGFPAWTAVLLVLLVAMILVVVIRI